MTNTLELGRRGEDLAVEYLVGRGLVILDRNWRCREGELDIVATDRTRLIVVEVKTRSGPDFGAPAEAVTPLKASTIRRVTSVWLATHRAGWCEVRFDVVSVVLPRGGGPAVVDHFERAF